MNKHNINTKIKSIVSTLWPALAVIIFFKLFTAAYAPSKVDIQKLNNAFSSNELVLLEFHASWCSTCLIQRNTLSHVLKNPDLKAIQHFTLNFDTESELKTRFNVTSQSTLILTKNGQELRRSVGLVAPSDLTRFLGQD